ncbi:MAG: methyltransferase domain-containing protein [Polyangiales bacterium]
MFTDDPITDTFRVYQRKRGHRYSVDDVVTAYQAVHAKPNAMTYADIGCGIGSVLLMVAYKLERTNILGVEAQDASYELVVKNVGRNGLTDRVELVHGDLRDLVYEARFHKHFDLVTGTPPYFPPGHATPSPDPQRRYARIEYRGGVEAYVKSAEFLMRDDGRAVICGSYSAQKRMQDACAAHALFIEERLDIFAKEANSEPLFNVFTLRRSTPDDSQTKVTRYISRTPDGRKSEQALNVRACFGLFDNPY